MLSDSEILTILSPDSYPVKSSFQESKHSYKWKNSADNILIFPFDPKNLTPVGYDLTVGQEYLSYSQEKRIKLDNGHKCVIQPGETVLIMTEEYIGVPNNKLICGLIASKVSLVSKGIGDISTTLDHDYEGRLLIGLTNHQLFPLTLEKGEQFATLLFFRSKVKAKGSCNKLPGREDLMVERMDDMLSAAQEAKKIAYQSGWRSHLVGLSSLAIIIIFSLIGVIWFTDTGNIEGFVAIGLAIALFVKEPVSKYVEKQAAIRSGNVDEASKN